MSDEIYNSSASVCQEASGGRHRAGASQARGAPRVADVQAARAHMLSRDSGPPLDRHWHVRPRPRAKRTLHQGAVVVLRLPGDFGADPRRQFDGLMLPAQFDLGNNQAVIVAQKHIDLPGEVAARYRNIILQLQPAQVQRSRFDGQRCGPITVDTNPNRCLAVGGQIGLAKGGTTGRELLPMVATHQKFSLDLETHSPSSTQTAQHAARDCDCENAVMTAGRSRDALSYSDIKGKQRRQALSGWCINATYGGSSSEISRSSLRIRGRWSQETDGHRRWSRGGHPE